jgi:hypothetical protein
MNEELGLIEELRNRVRELEDKVEALRISRRVLVNLVESVEIERREQLLSLQHRNERLQRSNYRFARLIMYRNMKITELERRLKDFSHST